MIEINLDDKYEVIRTLHESAATAVLLIRHKKIGAFRILKAISKASPDANSILSESHLLQGINSSLLPTIYEVEETEEVYYLIEEYIDGISLREYLLSNKINKQELLKLSIRICEIIEVLHTAGNEPIIYRDMKPEHLIMQNEQLRLIDFGISIKKSMAGMSLSYGTPGWSAPEQITGGIVDELSDIYAVGKVIEFMQMNSYAKDDMRIKFIINKATADEREERYESIYLLKKQLQSLLGSKENDNKTKKHLEKTIAVVGCTSGVGVTHIAIALCKYFNERNIDTYYKDIRKNTVNELWKNLKGARIIKGVLYHNSFKGIMNYGDAMKQYTPPRGLQIIDCGINIGSVLLDADIILYVTSGAPWQEMSEKPEWLNSDNVYVLNNFSNKIISLKSAKEINKRVYMYPTVRRSLGLSKDEERLFTAIIKNEKDFILQK